ncbi:MAG TPA: hypothetical protein VGJ28_19575 [Micromonosporaceae bacterium]|jgi:hypothetical protein
MKRVLGAAVIAIVLAGSLAGCGARARIAARAQQQPAATAPTTAPLTTAPHTTAPIQAASPDAQIAYIQQTLNGLNTTLNSIDSNITQADKAADSDQ